MQGRGWKFGDNVDTDVIIPGQYLKFSGAELVAHVMEGVDPTFGRKVQAGDIIVAGKNFGCGSSRETAPGVLKDAGIAAVIAPFFARIFYRNAINLGLPVLECADAGRIDQEDVLEVRLMEGAIVNLTKSEQYTFRPFPQNVMDILQAGGLVKYLESRFANEGDAAR
ncbi:3-isopropylmalate dehydratase small subunit [Alicyclobacillus cycloheptanicus]|nr:3-isopropylmalate dehydratase small subunit [Alicyclobacillus cycloheptanicus]